MARIERGEAGQGINPCMLPPPPSGDSLRDSLTSREPAIDDDLISFLFSMFPDKLPDHLQSEREIAYLIGQQSVIKLLRSMNTRQKEQTD